MRSNKCINIYALDILNVGEIYKVKVDLGKFPERQLDGKVLPHVVSLCAQVKKKKKNSIGMILNDTFLLFAVNNLNMVTFAVSFLLIAQNSNPIFESLVISI